MRKLTPALERAFMKLSLTEWRSTGEKKLGEEWEWLTSLGYNRKRNGPVQPEYLRKSQKEIIETLQDEIAKPNTPFFEDKSGISTTLG